MKATLKAAPAPLVPDKRGGRRALCHGTFLTMKGSAGWIRPIEEIDHPTCRWNKGDVYLAAEDVAPGVSLESGDSVVFYLYVDGKGLGAEDCRQVWHQHSNAEEVADESFACPYMGSYAVNLLSFYQDGEDGEESESGSSQPPTPAKPALCLDELVIDTPPLGDHGRWQPYDGGVELCAGLMKCFHQHTGDMDCLVDDDVSTDVEPTPQVIIEPEPEELGPPPSKGSVNHAEGTCKRCSFFPKNNCQNGADCEFCHYEHEKRPKRHKRKNKKAQQFEAEEADIVTTPPKVELLEPMKCDPSAFLLNFSKGLFTGDSKAGDSTPTTSEGSSGNANLSDVASMFGSPPTNERDPDQFGGFASPPPGLVPPPPGLEPPPSPQVVRGLDSELALVQAFA